MKILLLGANGQLGTDLQKQLPLAGHEVVSYDRAALDVADRERVRQTLAEVAPGLVINTTAFHNVELCETQPLDALNINALAVREIAVSCREQSCALMHFSTDFVFDGEGVRPYTEADSPNPLNVYAASKLAGEYMALQSMEKVYVVRTCGLYGTAGSSSRGGNFVDKVLKKASTGAPMRVVNDQVLTPTSTHDLACALAALIETNAFGVYHITNEGQCSWYEFACKAIQLQGLTSAEIAPQSSDDWPSNIRRPRYSVLSKSKLYSLGMPRMPHWEESLRKYLHTKH